MKIVKAPEQWPKAGRKIFLAGSIEMDLAEPWQDVVADALQDTDWILLNPRRTNWDSSLRQDKDEPAFKEQVDWELQGLEEAEAIIFYFDPKTKSPVTMLELGLYARSGKLLVCCPEGFWRRGNVAIVCERYGAPMLDDLQALILALRTRMA